MFHIRDKVIVNEKALNNFWYQKYYECIGIVMWASDKCCVVKIGSNGQIFGHRYLSNIKE